MRDIIVQNWTDDEGRPDGGLVTGAGIEIKWQKGPLGRVGTKERVAPNGAFVEDVIAAALERVRHYQESPFKCRENAIAITKLEEALHWLGSRTQRRIDDKTEGTHEGS